MMMTAKIIKEGCSDVINFIHFIHIHLAQETETLYNESLYLLTMKILGKKFEDGNMKQENPYVVSAAWLHQHLAEPDLRIIDASWALPHANLDARRQFEMAHIPGAVFFDQDEVVDKNSHLPHTIPSAQDFAAHVGAMGISDGNRIIVYEQVGYFAAPRVWWLFRLMGARHVYVLDGGLQAWAADGYEVTDTPTPVTSAIFTPDFQSQAVVGLEEMRKIVAEGTIQIADARGRARFSGYEGEPRPGMRGGHMPGAYNIPYPNMLRDDGHLKSLSQLRMAFEEAGLDIDKPVVTSCGSGVTAAILTLALQALGNKSVRLYDGSWSEWGSLSDVPIEQGERAN